VITKLKQNSELVFLPNCTVEVRVLLLQPVILGLLLIRKAMGFKFHSFFLPKKKPLESIGFPKALKRKYMCL